MLGLRAQLFTGVSSIATFFLLLVLWIFGSSIGVDATTAGILGFLILIVTRVLTWEEVIAEKTAWDTLLWFAALLMLSEYLTKLGVDEWLEHHVRGVLGEHTGFMAIGALVVVYYYFHYMFASTTAHITVLFSTFLLILIELGVPPIIAGVGLGVLSNLSAGLTNYGIASAPIYFSSGYFSTKEWLKLGALVSTFSLLLWASVGSLWWRLLGWW